MDDLRAALYVHGWKLAIGLTLVVMAGVFWGRTTNQANSGQNENISTPTMPPPSTPSSTRIASPTAVALVPTATATPRPPTQTPTPIPVYYVVEAGDMPLSIALQYDITVEALMRTNNITDATLLQIGQELLVPVTVTPSPTAPTPTPITPTPTAEPEYHTVRPGDTLLDIALEYETNVDLIMLANEILDPRSLQVGQQILIPSSEIDMDTQTVIHEIKSGDTFSYLSFFYGSTIDDILGANPGLDPNALQIGQSIIIPVTSPPINPEANPGLPQVINPSPIPATLTDLQTQMLNAVNGQRQAFGLNAYTGDDQLALMALAHAQDMVSRGYFAHISPEGVDLDTRFAQHQIEATWTGENIQRNIKPIDQTAGEAVRWFMSSAPHRANILHDRFNKIGVGVAEGPTGWYTFVLVFAER
jgi:uncharacterized protein YkwD